MRTLLIVGAVVVVVVVVAAGGFALVVTFVFPRVTPRELDFPVGLMIRFVPTMPRSRPGRSPPTARQMVVTPDEPNTVMPWWEFSGMTRTDLGTIYDYLRTVAPVRREIVTFEAKPAAN